MADEINFEVTGFGQLRQQLREAQLEMIKLAEAGKQGSKEFIAAAQRAGQLREAIKDAAESANVFTTEGKFQAVTKSLAAVSGGFTAIQGAIGLVSDDTKAFEETFKKLQSAMALTQGLTALSEMGDAFKNLGSVATSTFRSIQAAIGSTGIGLLIVGLGIAVQQLTSYFNEQTKAQKDAELQAEILARQLQELKFAYDQLSQSIAFNTQQDVIRAQVAGKSEVEIQDIKIKGAKDALKALDEARQKETSNFEERLRQNATSTQSQEKMTERYHEIKEEERKADEAYAKARAKAVNDVNTLENERPLVVQRVNQNINNSNQQLADKENARKVKALEDQKAFDIAQLESRRILESGLAKTDEERAAIEQKFTELKIAREAKFEIDREGLRKKDEKSATALQARLQELDNQSVTAAQDLEDKLKTIREKKEKDAEEARKKREADFKASSEEEYQTTLKYLDLYFAAQETKIRQETTNEEELKVKLQALEQEKLQARLDAAKDYTATVQKAGEDVINIELEIQRKKDELRQKEVEKDKKAQEEKLKNFKEYADLAINLAQGVTDAIAAKNDAEKQIEIERVKSSKQSEEEKAKAIDAINKEYFEKDKQIQIANAIISTLAGALNAFMSTLKVDPTGITGSILAAAALASGYFQIEKIRATTYESNLPSGSTDTPKPAGSRYAEGGVLGGPTHDMGGIRTAFGELEGGEFVVNRRATANFLPLLEMINAQGNIAGPEMPRSTYQPVIKTYVLATEVTSAQEANAKIAGLARLT